MAGRRLSKSKWEEDAASAGRADKGVRAWVGKEDRYRDLDYRAQMWVQCLEADYLPADRRSRSEEIDMASPATATPRSAAGGAPSEEEQLFRRWREQEDPE